MTESFEKAASEAKKLKTQPNHEEVNELYGLYKQARNGDLESERPWVFDVLGRRKWDSWMRKKGLSKEEAMAAYVELVEKLKRQYGI